ncbi:MAG TPA: putative sugar nucleotidyl transferase [bacterium]|nr:putative sugar nucleotidyl transferase [bacterium]
MNRGRLLLFEDESARDFEPLTLLRSVAQLRFGAWTHRERWEHLIPDREMGLICRSDLCESELESGHWSFVCSPRRPSESDHEEDTLFVAAAFGLPQRELLAEIRKLPAGQALVHEGRLLAARAAGRAAHHLAGGLSEIAGHDLLTPIAHAAFSSRIKMLEELGIAITEVSARLPRFLPDLIRENDSAIEHDFESYAGLLPAPSMSELPGVHAIRPDRIRMGEGVRVDPGVVLDAREGPILIGSGTSILANAVLRGPIAAGPRCLIKPGARIAGLSMGASCKVGGEIESSIIQGFSNKQHDGFLGHSYLGQWVNLGAATDTSDLKNNYGPVRVTIAGRERDSGSRHVGAFLGDHTKTGIHTMLNTGTVAGAFSNLFGAGFHPKEVPSFVWGGEGRWQEHELAKAMDVAAIVSARREVKYTDADRQLAARLYEATARHRRSWLSQF